ncbi:hypothetical protein EI94DRAFT_585995 [Lactarius quietus]|nr:hypothetical protein EI94DRAFT_585995 [Lactarius quietus]
MAAEAAQRNPDVLERVKARALVEALEKARYDLAMDAVRMAQVQAEVLESARERMKDEQSDALAEWRSVDWESLPEADRASIRKNAEHDILQIAIAKVKQEEQEISVEAKRANTAEIETWKLTELEATKAELLAEAKSKVTVKIFANHEKFREEAMAELKDKIDLEAKAWGVKYRAQKLKAVEAAMDNAVTNCEKQAVFVAARKLGISLESEMDSARVPKPLKRKKAASQTAAAQLRDNATAGNKRSASGKVQSRPASLAGTPTLTSSRTLPSVDVNMESRPGDVEDNDATPQASPT